MQKSSDPANTPTKANALRYTPSSPQSMLSPTLCSAAPVGTRLVASSSSSSKHCVAALLDSRRLQKRGRRRRCLPCLRNGHQPPRATDTGPIPDAGAERGQGDSDRDPRIAFGIGMGERSAGPNLRRRKRAGARRRRLPFAHSSLDRRWVGFGWVGWCIHTTPPMKPRGRSINYSFS